MFKKYAHAFSDIIKDTLSHIQNNRNEDDNPKGPLKYYQKISKIQIKCNN